MTTFINVLAVLGLAMGVVLMFTSAPVVGLAIAVANVQTMAMTDDMDE